jgi:hypothetical protein
MKIKTQDLIDGPLDWAVEVSEEMTVSQREFQPSTNWSQGGPIIEREKISIGKADDPDWWAFKGWKAEDGTPGPTPLIAAMRCFVASRLGDEVDVPANLIV